MIKVISALAVCLCILPVAAQESLEPPCPGIAKLSTWTDSWKAITFEFQQLSTMPGMDYEQTARGKVSIVKPWIRWDYHEPEPYTILTDSRRVWMIMPEDRQVITDLLDGFQLERIPILFLQDVTSLLKNYQCLADGSKSENTINLVRTNSTLNVQKITIILDAEGRPTDVGFIMGDDARNRFLTTQYHSATGLSKKGLALTIPADYSILNFQGDQISKETLNPLRELE